jgi:hypothetical protein
LKVLEAFNSTRITSPVKLIGNMLFLNFAVSVEGKAGYKWCSFCTFGGAIGTRPHFSSFC